MDRRIFLALSATGVALRQVSTPAFAANRLGSAGGFESWRRRFLDLPGSKSFLIQKGEEWGRTNASYQPDNPLFVGSAVKTFILAKYLQKVETGALSENELLAIDDSVRSLVSPVFGSEANPANNLAGKASARTALEAMIAHSDNTGTDVALNRVGAADVRAFIAAAGLTQTRIPDSTRILFSYIAGAPYGTDEGWAGMETIMAGGYFGAPRSPINDKETMISTASELVSFYQRALAGQFFAKPETLTEFKRIQAMADILAVVVPDGIAAYGKGGSIDWQDFHAVCAAGQMIVRGVPVTFCFTLNWSGPDSGVREVAGTFAASAGGMLATVAGHAA